MSYVGATAATAGSSPYNISVPSGKAANDVAWVVLVCVNTATLSVPSGFTQIDTADYGNMRFGLYRKVLAGTETTVSVTGGTSNAACMIVMRSADTTTPEKYQADAGANSASTTRAIPSTTTDETCDLVAFAMSRGNLPPTSWTPGSPWILAEDAFRTGSGATTCAVAYQEAVPAGSVGGQNWTSDTNELRGAAILIVVNPAGGGGPTYEKLNILEGGALVQVDVLGPLESGVPQACEVLGVTESGSIVPVEVS